jgi:plastocyanin
MFLSRLMVIGAFAATFACSGSTPTTPNSGGQMLPSGTVGVTIQDFTFSPASLTITAGTTVRWINNGPSAHTTVSDMGLWTSGVLSPPGSGGGPYGGGGSAGATFDFTFMQPGTFPYHCALHPPNLYPGFIGTVTVTQ